MMTAVVLGLLASRGSISGAQDWGSVEIGGHSIPPGSKTKFTPRTGATFEEGFFDLPVFVARGIRPGPFACVISGIHGDEINGYESSRRVFAEVDPEDLAGTLAILPAVNIHGFRSGNRYLSDRRDLNRYFPGKRSGSVASYLAHAVFQRFVRRCAFLIDLHTASLKRDNLPQIRVDLEHQPSVRVAREFGLGLIVGGKGPDGSLRREAVRAGIPTIIYEAGEPHRFDEASIASGARGILNVLKRREMIRGEPESDELVFVRESRWVRAPLRGGGFFFPTEPLGAEVREGQVIGFIVEPLTDAKLDIVSPVSGRIIGQAYAQPVLSGYALIHVGLM
ncbi:MAG: succinylglutamate desuccinylase/aspartoacylase family protein [Myxococcota bacterium]